MKRAKFIFLLFSLQFVQFGMITPQNALRRESMCRMRGPAVNGDFKLYQNCRNCVVRIRGRMWGLSPGRHGLHIHESGDIGNRCQNAGPHFNPFGRVHGSLTGNRRHCGDLGNIAANRRGIADVSIVLTSTCMQRLEGKSIVVHEKEDDLGRAIGLRRDESLKTGNSGGRIGCCLIT